MFNFDIGFVKLLHAFEVVFYFFIYNGRFVVRVFILQLEIRRVGFIEIYCLFEINSIYQLRGLNYSCIAGISKLAMPKSYL